MNKSSKTYGIFLACLAAIMFGLSAITAKLGQTYSGTGGITTAFYRDLFVLPVLLVMLKVKGESLKLTKKQLVLMMLVGLLCGGLTAMLLYVAYEYISVGLTMCLHFTYPMVSAVLCFALFKEKLSKIQIASLVLALGGIWIMMFSGGEDFNMTGIIIALLSALVYGSYLVLMGKSSVSDLSGFKIAFYNNLFGCMFLGIFGLMARQDFTTCHPKGWIWLFITGVFVACIANALTPEAVKLIGPTVTGVLGILEPITSLVCSILLLNEAFTAKSLIGGIIVLAGAVLITIGTKNEPEKETE
ncbi:MAG: DMT family transporter [Clostridia bacterium]|nr:DMT family transporter [Clostridia bacterium]